MSSDAKPDPVPPPKLWKMRKPWRPVHWSAYGTERDMYGTERDMYGTERDVYGRRISGGMCILSYIIWWQYSSFGETLSRVKSAV